ncbi:MAG: ATP-binding protein [Ignavibacteria bacterium]|nr:ATP-binding protein [Ignavibacteria bacterium]
MALKVRIFSFSYIYGSIPFDETGNGGGFVFDCRFIVNPGQIEEFWHLTGKDKEVIEFLDKQPDMQEFLKDVFNIIKKAIINYQGKGFTDLMISFGCTGGMHRSVYAAERTAEFIRNEFPDVEVTISHNEFPGL